MPIRLPKLRTNNLIKAAEEEAPAFERAFENKPKDLIPEEALARDVTPPVEEPITPHEEVKADFTDLSNDAKEVAKDPSKLSSFAKRHGGKLAALGLVGAGTAAMYSGANKPPSQQPESPSDRQPASIDPMDIPAKSTGDNSEDVADSSPDDQMPISKLNPVPASMSLPKVEKPEATPLLTKLREMNFGDNSQGSAQALQDAQDQARQTRLANMLGKSASLFGASLAKANAPDTSVYEENIKNANLPVEEYKQRVENEKNDPNSTYSQGIRSFLESQFGVKINGAPSATQLATVAPWLEKAYETEETRKQKAAENALTRENQRNLLNSKNKELETIAKIHAADRRAAQDIRLEEKQSQMDTKRLDMMGKLVTSEVASSRSAFGKAANNVNSAERIETLISQANGNLQNLDNRQIAELARGLDALISQGQPTITGTGKLIPETMHGNVSKIAEYISGQPVGAGQQEFVKRMLDTVQREKGLARDQIKRTQNKILAPYADLKKRNPEGYNNILQAHGLGEDQSESQTASSSQKTVIRKGYNPKTDQTQLIYSDGTKEIVDGKR